MIRISNVTFILAVVLSSTQAGEMPSVRIAKDKNAFILQPSGKAFVPLGFNYDHDQKGRLIEDYWIDEWPKIERDFQE